MGLITDRDQAELRRRWRLVLGRHSDQPLQQDSEVPDGTRSKGKCPAGAGRSRLLDQSDQRRDQLLDFLYQREYQGRQYSGRQGGSGDSVFTAPEWLRQVRELFPHSTVEVLQHQALERYGLQELITDPEVLATLPPSMERGQALVTQMQQLDLPQPSRELQGLLQRLVPELNAQSGSDAAGIRRNLAPLWARLGALTSRPLPQPLQDLGGVHKRFYRRVDQLLLYVAGIEIWRRHERAQGLSFYLYAPQQRRWYRHGQVRSRQQAEAGNWSPQRCLQQESWGDGPPYKLLNGRSLLLVTGWVSADGHLSGRPGTRLTLRDETPALPVYQRYRQLAQDYVAGLPALGEFGFHRFPAVIAIAIAGCEPARLDEIQQRWSKRVFDPTGLVLHLQLGLNTDTTNRLDGLRQLEGAENREKLVFGLVGGEGAILTLSPISIKLDPQSPWQHLSL